MTLGRPVEFGCELWRLEAGLRPRDLVEPRFRRFRSVPRPSRFRSPRQTGRSRLKTRRAPADARQDHRRCELYGSALDGPAASIEKNADSTHAARSSPSTIDANRNRHRGRGIRGRPRRGSRCSARNPTRRRRWLARRNRFRPRTRRRRRAGTVGAPAPTRNEYDRPPADRPSPLSRSGRSHVRRRSEDRRCRGFPSHRAKGPPSATKNGRPHHVEGERAVARDLIGDAGFRDDHLYVEAGAGADARVDPGRTVVRVTLLRTDRRQLSCTLLRPEPGATARAARRRQFRCEADVLPPHPCPVVTATCQQFGIMPLDLYKTEGLDESRVFIIASTRLPEDATL